MHPITPDGRYFVVRQQLWRCSNPTLDDATRSRLVSELMTARRAVKVAKKAGAASDLSAARAAVNKAKIALGERGPVWWSDGSPDFNRRQVANSPYAQWYEMLEV